MAIVAIERSVNGVNLAWSSRGVRRCGVGRSMDGLQVSDRDLGVDLGGGDVGVAEHLLDVSDVGAAFQHQCGHRVAEQVTGALFGTPGCLT